MLGTMSEKLTDQQVLDAGLTGWATHDDALHVRFDTGDFAKALALVDAIGAVAEELNHHPDLELGWGRVEVHLTSHDVGGITGRDLTLARRIDELATEAGVRASP